MTDTKHSLCSCKATLIKQGVTVIEMCPLHAAAQGLLDACRLVRDCAFLDSRCTEEQWTAACDAVDAAIASAEVRA